MINYYKTIFIFSLEFIKLVLYLWCRKTETLNQIKMKSRINKAYNEFRNNVTPLMFNKVQIGSMTMEVFENWFDQREETFFSLMDKHNI